jgi:hypothetical protein
LPVDFDVSGKLMGGYSGFWFAGDADDAVGVGEADDRHGLGGVEGEADLVAAGFVLDDEGAGPADRYAVAYANGHFEHRRAIITLTLWLN